MNWIKKNGDILFVTLAALYATTRNSQDGWNYTDTLVMTGLVLMALSRLLRKFSK